MAKSLFGKLHDVTTGAVGRGKLVVKTLTKTAATKAAQTTGVILSLVPGYKALTKTPSKGPARNAVPPMSPAVRAAPSNAEPATESTPTVPTPAVVAKVVAKKAPAKKSTTKAPVKKAAKRPASGPGAKLPVRKATPPRG